ncbi:ASCH domain-containing protein [Xenorhabdus bovienii]|uniref:ASCH domain-containing protein n=1 Tax=Xenorhabdus bovienii TaxID=40576 RepID=UPI001EDEDC28|nr:ASCH domain-containing protein [Xenorhabdus bovienii]MCG3469361.1 ASCH domain-containing protein [Xenorhabdus bovienii]
MLPLKQLHQKYPSASSWSFSDSPELADELARKEGEGDLSLSYWRKEHQNFFERKGTYFENMELVFEEFELIETE